MFDNNIILLGIIIILICCFMNSTEKLTNVESSERKKNLAYMIKMKFNDLTTMLSYLDELERLGNKSLNLLEAQTFYDLRKLFRENKLTEEAIMSYMIDI
jgi:hypothetical protein